jgi:hypothetical protein
VFYASLVEIQMQITELQIRAAPTQKVKSQPIRLQLQKKNPSGVFADVAWKDDAPSSAVRNGGKIMTRL